MATNHSPLRVRRVRQRERRALASVLADALAAVAIDTTAADFVARLEAGLRPIGLVRAIRLERAKGAPPRHPVTTSTSLTLPVPVPMGHASAVLTVLAPGAIRLDDWTRQIWAQVAAVVGVLLRAETAIASRGAAPLSGARRAPVSSALLGESPVMVGLRVHIARMAATDYPVLITGESGSGKEVVAREIHRCSARGRGPFVAVNCGALVSTLLEADLFGIEDGIATGVRGRPGKFEAARGGTIFLDEVAELSRAGQVSLLRVLQERVVERVGSHRPVLVDVRVVAATHQDLDALVARRRFRFDLLQRLRVLELVLPPLRTRGADILHLAQTFLSREAASRSWSFAPAVQAALLRYPWPGNVRELAGAMQSVAALAPSSIVTLDDLPRRLTATNYSRPTVVSRRYPTLWEIVTAAAQDAFDRHEGNKRRACAELEINYRTFERLREAVPGRIPFSRLRRAA